MGLEDELAAALGASSVKFLGEGTFGQTYRVDGSEITTIRSRLRC